MKVLLTTGFPNAPIAQIFEILCRAGVAAAAPSRKEGLSPQALQQMLLRSYEVDLDEAATLEQIRPGRLWNELAADLFLENVKGSLWGWADRQSAPLLDFWGDFDPQVRFLLVYETLQQHLTDALASSPGAGAGAEAAQSATAQWRSWNTALLNFYRRNEHRCLLVNAEAVLARPDSLFEALRAKWDITGLRDISSTNHPPVTRQQSYPLLSQYLSSQLIQVNHPAMAVARELDSEADVPPQKGQQKAASPFEVWTEWVAARGQLDLATYEERRLRAEHDQLVADRQLLASELESHKIRSAQLADLGELAQENRFLLVQLQQAEEELESYFAKSQAPIEQSIPPAAAFTSDFWRIHQPEILHIDMRLEVAGTNWYAAEVDGRWAGPAAVSTLQLPPVQAGSYTVELEVVDAMNTHIVRGMELSILDKTYPVRILELGKADSYPLFCTAEVSVPPQYSVQPWSIELRFPEVASPSIEMGSEDGRHLAVRLGSLRLIKNTA